MKPKKYASTTTTTSSDLMVVKKKKKKKKRMTTTTSCSNNGVDDLISELPDPIIHHIFSYLDMSSVIQTSFLSRRWRFMWASLPFLNFDEKVYCSKLLFRNNDFMTFIHRVLLFRNQNSNIHSFHVHRFKFEDLNTSAHIHTWMHVLFRCNVQVLDIQADSSHVIHFDSITFPMSFFTCKSLTTLKLDFGDYCYSPIPLKLVPPAASSSMVPLYLPALKTLHLISLRFFDFSGIEMLISRSPVLETLLISRCIYCEIEPQTLTISNAHLKSLVIIRKKKELPDHYCRLKLVTPNLISFTAKDYPISHYSLEKLPSLVKAEINDDYESYNSMDSDIDYDPGDFVTECTENVIKCLRGFCNARSLALSTWVLALVGEALEEVEGLQIDPFCNLTFLSLNTSLSKYQICAITYLLAKCPNLRTLLLQMPKEHSISVEQEDEYWEAESAPHCVMHDLELVGIWDVVASTNELEFLKFLLNNAVVLEKMLIFISPDQRPTFERFKSFHDELMDLSLWSDKGVGFDGKTDEGWEALAIWHHNE